MNESVVASSSWSPEKEAETPEKDYAFWETLGWAYAEHPEHRNIDQVSASIDFNCPECGAVFVEITAIGFLAPTLRHGKLQTHGDRTFLIPNASIVFLTARAVRMLCYSDHIVQYDWVSGKKQVVKTPTWAKLGIGAALMSAGILAYYFVQRRNET